jgi:hypothetical protein
MVRQIHRDYLVPFFKRNFFSGLHRSVDPGIVDQNVHRAESSPRTIDDPSAVLTPAHLGGHAPYLSSSPISDSTSLWVGAVTNSCAPTAAKRRAIARPIPPVPAANHGYSML